jgi:hypothetical protein
MMFIRQGKVYGCFCLLEATGGTAVLSYGARWRDALFYKHFYRLDNFCN